MLFVFYLFANQINRVDYVFLGTEAGCYLWTIRMDVRLKLYDLNES